MKSGCSGGTHLYFYLYYKACCQNTNEMTALPNCIFCIISFATDLYSCLYGYHIQATHSIVVLPRVAHSTLRILHQLKLSTSIQNLHSKTALRFWGKVCTPSCFLTIVSLLKTICVYSFLAAFFDYCRFSAVAFCALIDGLRRWV